jgi:uncharacterized membrane protein YiaA
MALSDSEQKRLDEIERALLQDDPKFAAKVSIGHVRRRRRFAAAAVFVLGMVVLLAGLVDTAQSTLTGVLISILGVLMMGAAAATLLLRPRRHRP